jgi:AraC-like DNA-binding protein
MQEPSINFLSILILIGSGQALFLALVLVFTRRGNRRLNLLCIAGFFVASLTLLDGFMYVTNYYSRYPHLIGVVWPVYYLYWPLLYIYIRELTSLKPIVFSWKQSVHLFPAVLTALLLIPLYSVSANEKIVIWARLNAPIERMSLFTLTVAPLMVILPKAVYFALSFRLIMAYRSRIKQSFSSIEKISLSWLSTLLILYFVICVLCIFFILIAASLGIQRETGNFFYLGMAVVTYVISFKAVHQPEIFTRNETAIQAELIRTGQGMVPDAPSPDPVTPRETGVMMDKGKYQRSWLTDERSADLARQLLDLMESKKLYLEPELTLAQLSEKLAVTPHLLSQVFNREMNNSFFDFVNEYRVEEAKKLLSSPQYGHYSIFGIALDAGFNSKSAFYTAFGKYAGTTPSEFRKRQQRAWSEQEAAPNPQGRA